MDITFTVESTNGKTWTATCADPVLECTGNDIITVSKLMADSIEKWFISTFNTTRRVVVEVPVIKAKVKASVSVRAETPLDEFHAKTIDENKEVSTTVETHLVPCSGCGMEIMARVDEKSPICQSCSYDREVHAQNGVVDDDLHEPKRKALPMPPRGPCAYISDGKGIVPVGTCEAISNDPADTPGIMADSDGICNADYERCKYYKAGGIRTSKIDEEDTGYVHVVGEEIDGYDDRFDEEDDVY